MTDEIWDINPPLPAPLSAAVTTRTTALRINDSCIDQFSGKQHHHSFLFSPPLICVAWKIQNVWCESETNKTLNPRPETLCLITVLVCKWRHCSWRAQVHLDCHFRCFTQLIFMNLSTCLWREGSDLRGFLVCLLPCRWVPPTREGAQEDSRVPLGAVLIWVARLMWTVGCLIDSVKPTPIFNT